MPIPQKIQQLAKKVREAVYGKDVRDAIAEAIEESGKTAGEAREITEALLDGSFDQGLLDTEIREKLVQLEQDYAPELTNLGAQLAQTMNNIDGFVDVKQFGAVGDGVADDTQAFKDAIAYIKKSTASIVDPADVKTLFGSGRYKLTDTIDMRRIPVFMPFGYFIINHSGVGIILGGLANQSRNPEQNIYRVHREGFSDSADAPTVRIIGAKGQTISIHSSSYIQLYASDGTSSYSSAYSTFNFNFAGTLHLTSVTDNGDINWINENTFNLKRLTNLLVDGTYSHNHNIFNGGTFENGGEIRFEKGNSNRMKNVRGESDSAGIFFGAGTWDNSIEISWMSSPSGFIRGGAGVWPEARAFTDNGTGNLVKYTHAAERRYYPVLQVDDRVKSFSRTATNATSIEGLSLTRRGVDTFGRAAWSQIIRTGLMPVTKGMVIFFKADTSVYRPLIVAYDVNRQPIGTTGLQPQGGLTSVTGDGAYTPESGWSLSNNGSNIAVLVSSSDVRFVQVYVRSGNAASLIKSFSIWVGTPEDQLGGRSPIKYFNLNSLFINPVVSSSPTAGFAPVGYKLSNINGGWFTNTFALNTKSSTAKIATDTTIDVETGTGISVGDIVGVEYTPDEAQWTTVSAISGTTVTLTDALTNDVGIGARVVFNRWINS